jgi:hypothetical protein
MTTLSVLCDNDNVHAVVEFGVKHYCFFVTMTM